MSQNSYFLRSRDVSHILDLSPDEVAELAQSGKLKAKKVGRIWRYSLADVMAYIQGETQGETNMPSLNSLEHLKKTTECEKGFVCLSHKIDSVCSIEESRDNMRLFVKAPADIECVYKIPFGGSFFCACPMRTELYQRYGV